MQKSMSVKARLKLTFRVYPVFNKATNNAETSRVSDDMRLFFCPISEKEIFDYEERKRSNSNRKHN